MQTAHSASVLARPSASALCEITNDLARDVQQVRIHHTQNSALDYECKTFQAKQPVPKPPHKNTKHTLGEPGWSGPLKTDSIRGIDAVLKDPNRTRKDFLRVMKYDSRSWIRGCSSGKQGAAIYRCYSHEQCRLGNGSKRKIHQVNGTWEIERNDVECAGEELQDDRQRQGLRHHPLLPQAQTLLTAARSTPFDSQAELLKKHWDGSEERHDDIPDLEQMRHLNRALRPVRPLFPRLKRSLRNEKAVFQVIRFRNNLQSAATFSADCRGGKEMRDQNATRRFPP